MTPLELLLALHGATVSPLPEPEGDGARLAALSGALGTLRALGVCGVALSFGASLDVVDIMWEPNNVLDVMAVKVGDTELDII